MLRCIENIQEDEMTLCKFAVYLLVTVRISAKLDRGGGRCLRTSAGLAVTVAPLALSGQASLRSLRMTEQ